jgi:hypothetical protein
MDSLVGVALGVAAVGGLGEGVGDGRPCTSRTRTTTPVIVTATTSVYMGSAPQSRGTGRRRRKGRRKGAGRKDGTEVRYRMQWICGL